MKRAAIIFWMLYMLFFAIPFPMLLYYNINSEYDISGLKDKDPWLALSILALSLILWFVLLAGYFHKWVIQIFIAKGNIEKIKAHGIRREAKILSVTKLVHSQTGYESYKLNLSLKNLANTEIKLETEVNDSKPHERRYEVGKRVDLLIDQEMIHAPYYIFSTAETSMKTTRLVLIILAWLALLAVIIGYYAFSYQYESYDAGWRFISFGHPLLICPLVLLFYRYFLKFIFRKIAGSSADDALLIKFKGIRTTANLIAANQTGTYINEQPMIRFELEYTDQQGQVYCASLKKIVNLLDLDITKQPHVDIFYLKENSKKVAFASDMDHIS